MKKRDKKDISVLITFLAVIGIAGVIVAGNSIYRSFTEPRETGQQKTIEENLPYPETVNNAESRQLVEAARAYITGEPRVFFDNTRWVKWNDREKLGMQLDASLFLDNRPDSVEYIPLGNHDPPYAHLNNKYIVLWKFNPSCEKGFLRGCNPTYTLKALIDFRIRAEQILVDQIGK